jgi:hypothetical protein
VKKYTDEELSRILSASAAGILGRPQGGTACIEQAALASCSLALGSLREEGGDSSRGIAFDMAYKSAAFRASLADPDAVLAWIEKRGMA